MENGRRVAEVVGRAVRESVGAGRTIEPNEPLLQSGIVDSLNLLQIVVAIQSELGVAIEVDEINEENFQDIESITAFIDSKSSHLS